MVADDAGSEEVHAAAEPGGFEYTEEDPFETRGAQGAVCCGWDLRIDCKFRLQGSILNASVFRTLASMRMVCSRFEWLQCLPSLPVWACISLVSQEVRYRACT